MPQTLGLLGLQESRKYGSEISNIGLNTLKHILSILFWCLSCSAYALLHRLQDQYWLASGCVFAHLSQNQGIV